VGNVVNGVETEIEEGEIDAVAGQGEGEARSEEGHMRKKARRT
jgi:hypothetical protein